MLLSEFQEGFRSTKIDLLSLKCAYNGIVWRYLWHTVLLKSCSLTEAFQVYRVLINDRIRKITRLCDKLTDTFLTLSKVHIKSKCWNWRFLQSDGSHSCCASSLHSNWLKFYDLGHTGATYWEGKHLDRCRRR